MYNSVLSHYGIAGMHWGRKMSGHSGIKVKTQSMRTPSQDHTDKVALKGKKIHEMSNDEIRKLTTRLNLEKQIKDLHPDKFKKGKNIVKGVLATGTTVTALYTLATSPLASKIIAAMKKKVG